jgi:hypothetical protein
MYEKIKMQHAFFLYVACTQLSTKKLWDMCEVICLKSKMSWVENKGEFGIEENTEVLYGV